MTNPSAEELQARADYANSRRVITGKAVTLRITGKAVTLRIPVVVVGQLLSELDDGGRQYADEALGPLLVQACIDVALRDETEEMPCLKSA